jgi:hypothetical protein
MTFNRRRVFAGLFAEVSFTTLPLLIVLIVLLNYEHGEHIVQSPEWSFGAAILFGQALVKFMTGMAHGGRAAHGPVSLAITLIIVFGLAPSLLVLTLVLIDMEAIPRREPAEWLSVLQVVLFLLGAATYLVFGTVGELWRHHETIAVVERGRS